MSVTCYIIIRFKTLQDMDTRIKSTASVNVDMSNIGDILEIIPIDVIEKLAYETKVDYRVKLLQGSVMFNMLLQLLISGSRASQRNAYEILTKGVSCLNPKIVPGRGVRDHTSITKRLSTINCDFFERIYGHVRDMIAPLYTPSQLAGMHIVAVDSTIVAETCNKLADGFHIGNKSSDGSQSKHVKYTDAFDGLTVRGVAFNDDPTKQAENNALPQVIKDVAMLDPLHANLYVIDRGLTSAETLAELSGQDDKREEGQTEGKTEGKPDAGKVNFLVRISNNRRLEVVSQFDCGQKEYDTEDGRHIRILEYGKVRIFKSAARKPEDAEYFHVKAIVSTEARDKNGKALETSEKVVNLLTDVEGLSAMEMLEAYRKRWMVEVFFKFLKQNFDFSHIISTTANGLKVMMYMTMIAAMLVLIYGKSRQIGFRRAKWEFDNDLQKLTIALLIILVGGDPEEFMRTQNLRFPRWLLEALPPKAHALGAVVTDYEQVHSFLVKKCLFHH